MSSVHTVDRGHHQPQFFFLLLDLCLLFNDVGDLLISTSENDRGDHQFCYLQDVEILRQLGRARSSLIELCGTRIT